MVVELGGPQALSPREVVRMFEAAGAGEIATETVPESALESQLNAATDSLQKSFAGLMLQCAGGDVIDITTSEPAVPVSNDLGARLHHRPARESRETAMRTESPIVLVHGAFQSAATWDLVAPRLREAGRHVIVATLTGLGRRCRRPVGDRDSCRHAHPRRRRAAERDDLHDVVLVGHSYAGMIITGVAEQAADRIRHLVYVDALVPEHGQAAMHLLPQPTRDTFRKLAERRRRLANAADGSSARFVGP